MREERRQRSSLFEMTGAGGGLKWVEPNHLTQKMGLFNYVCSMVGNVVDTKLVWKKIRHLDFIFKKIIFLTVYRMRIKSMLNELSVFVIKLSIMAIPTLIFSHCFYFPV